VAVWNDVSTAATRAVVVSVIQLVGSDCDGPYEQGVVGDVDDADTLASRQRPAEAADRP
jgi:hypothetical protein